MPAPRARANPSPRAPQPDPDEARPNREQGIAPRGQTGPREPSGRPPPPPAGPRRPAHEPPPPQRPRLARRASATHNTQPGPRGPIPPRLYKPDDKVGPSNWVHNLEHGALVVLYRNDSPGAAAAGQQAFRDFISAFPPSPICKLAVGQLSPVIARFDDMPHPFAALVWDRVFYLDTSDPALVSQF